MTIDFHPAAEAEVTRITDRYEEHRAGLGTEFVDELERALEVILASPGAWPFWPNIPERLLVRRFLLTRFPYGLPFRIESDDRIRIYAVAHLRRRPGYWRGRLGSG